MKLKEYRPAAAKNLKRRTVVGSKVSILEAVTRWGDFMALPVIVGRLCR